MKFNFDKFSDLLHKNKSKTTSDEKGLYNVIQNVWNLESIKEIDFDSFTYDDVIDALNIFEMSVIHYNELNETVVLDPGNPFVKYYETESSILKLQHAKRKYQIDNDEDIFI